MSSTPALAVLLPVKAFAEAKVRLSPALDPHARARLARAMAATVVQASKPHDLYVVCDDDEVAGWATDLGAEVLWRPGLGLNGAVTDGVDALDRLGFDRVVVVHADLPHIVELDAVLGGDGITLVPDRRDDGTNVVVVPADSGFRFAYGPGSFTRHAAEAERLGHVPSIVRDDRLSWDVDVPDDLRTPAWADPGIT